MKLISALAVATAAGGMCVAPAFAQEAAAPAAPQSSASGFYAGGGGNLYFLDRDYAAEGLPLSFEDQPSPAAFMGRIGYAFNEYIAVEAELGIGGADSDFTTSGGGADGNIGIENPLGAHVVLTMPLGAGGSYILGKVGYVSASVTREYLGVDADDLDLNGAALGAGAGMRAGPWDFRLEYSFMTDSESGDGGVLGMFALHHF